MATPVANTNALLSSLSTAETQFIPSVSNPAQSLGLFQIALAVAVARTPQTDTALATQLTIQDLQLDEDAITEGADATVLAGTLPGITQLLIPTVPAQNLTAPQQGPPLDGVTTSAVAGQTPASPTLLANQTEVLNRSEQLILDRPAVTVGTDQPLTQLPGTRTQTVARTIPQTVNPVPVATVSTATEQMSVNAPADTTAVPVRSPRIPAQAPIVTGLLPNLQAASQLAPLPELPTPIVTIPLSGLPGVQVGDRPLMAGDRFTALASAGARLANSAVATVAFNQVLGQEVGVTLEPTQLADRDAVAASLVSGTGPLSQPGVAQPAAVAQTPAVQLADEIVTQARVLDRDGAVEFQLQLDPPELGRVRVNLLASGDEIHGQVIVADDAVRRMIETHLPDLRQRLEAAGLNIQRFDIAADPGTGGGRNPYREDSPSRLFLNHSLPPSFAPRSSVQSKLTAGGIDITV